jgi:hypothetical protein
MSIQLQQFCWTVIPLIYTWEKPPLHTLISSLGPESFNCVLYLTLAVAVRSVPVESGIEPLYKVQARKRIESSSPKIVPAHVPARLERLICGSLRFPQLSE